MPRKVYRGFNTGNTIRRLELFFHKQLPRKAFSNVREGIIYVKRFDYQDDLYGDTNPKVKFDGNEFEVEVPYSLKKKQRWRLRHALAERLSQPDCPFYNDLVEVAEGNLVGRRRPLARYYLRKPARSDGDCVRECCSRRGYINLPREAGMMRKEEEDARPSDDDDEEEEADRPASGKPRFRPPPPREICFSINTAVRPAMLDRIPSEWRFVTREADSPATRRRRSVDIDQFVDDDAVEQDVREQLLAEQDDDDDDGDCARAPTRAITLEDFPVRRATERQAKRRRQRSLCDSASEASTKKNRKVVEAPEEVAEEAPPASDVLELSDAFAMAPARLRLAQAEVAPRALLAEFGDHYREGASCPRKFLLSIGEEVALGAGEKAGVAPSVFLVFEEALPSPDAPEFAVFLNADAQGVDCLALPSPEGPGDGAGPHALRPFVDLCAATVAERYGARLRCWAATAVVRLPAASRPLSAASAMTEDLLRGDLGAAEPAGEQATPVLADENANLGCGICFESLVAPEAEPGLGVSGCCLSACGHLFCDGCWRLHLVASLRLGRARLLCPHLGCAARVDLATALRFVAFPTLAPTLKKAETNAADVDPRASWCPRPACGRLVLLEQPPPSGHPGNVVCACGQVFCFSCREEAHWPASCAAYQRYTVKMKRMGDVETLQANDSQLTVKGKNCPKCRKFIEKNGGCPHMTCVCGNEFCWVCGYSFDEHVTYCYLSRNRRLEVGEHSLVEEITTPSQARTKDYSNSLRWRCYRLHARLRKEYKLRQDHLHRLAKGIVVSSQGVKDSKEFRMLVFRKQEDLNRQYQELLRVVEFCYVAALCVNKAHRLLANRMRFVAEEMASMTTQVRDIVNARSSANSERVEKIFRRARKETERVENHFISRITEHETLSSYL